MKDKTSRRNRVLLVAHDVVSGKMAGPGIRALELARVLGKEFEVILATPNNCELEEQHIHIHPYHNGNWETLQALFREVDVIIANGFTLYQFPQALRSELETPLIVDLYDPFPLENLNLFKDTTQARQQQVHQRDLAVVEIMCTLGDFFICANTRQRDWWLGVLQAKGRINALTAAESPTLHTLIDEVPFGLPEHPFKKEGHGPKTTHPALTTNDKLILWGGGLWDWLDPLTLIRAMPAISASEPRAKLLFPGTRHPNPEVPFMKRTREALALAEALGLRDKTVFFGEWVAYEEWPNYLADTDVAVSLHFDTIETQFSAVRSRVLSYIWAHLPMVVTEGDTASELVATHHLGEVVTPTDVEQVSQAILTVLKNGKAHYSSHFSELASQLTWHNVAEPLLAFCRAPRFAADKAPAWLERQKKLVLRQEVIAAQTELKNSTGDAKQAQELARQQNQILRQQEYIMAQENKSRALQTLVQGYERGRFMTLMRQIDRLKRKILHNS